MTLGSNAATYFVDRHRGTETARKPAFVEAIDGGRTLSYSDLADQSDRMAALYRAHGLRREDRAVMLVHDTIEFPVIFWGSLKAGILPVPLNTLLTTDTYDAILRDSRARALFVSEPLVPVVKDILPDNPFLEAVFVVGGNTGAPSAAAAKAEGESLFGRMFGHAATPDAPSRSKSAMVSFAEALASSTPAPAIDVTPDEYAFWLYSSGSTGLPKGVRHVHGNLKSTSDTYGQQVLGITAEDTIYSAAKLFFAYGLGNAMTFPMAVGATTALLPGRPTPESVFDVMERAQPTIFCGVPTLFASMLAHLGDSGKPAGARRLRRSISAGEALPADIGQRWRDVMGSDILDGVGSTEMLHIFLSNAPESVVYGTSGVPVPGYEVRLVDEAGADVADGEIGEMLVKGESSADGYWNQRAKSRAAFEGAWTRTGDKYERTPEGRYVYCGRTDDMFKVSGIWVSPFEVEQALVSHPSVLEAAVVAQRDEEGLEKPKAFVVLQPGVQQSGLQDSLKQHVQDKVGKWKYPRWIEIMDELPKTATGKIQRFKLRDSQAGEQ